MSASPNLKQVNISVLHINVVMIKYCVTSNFTGRNTYNFSADYNKSMGGGCAVPEQFMQKNLINKLQKKSNLNIMV